MSTYALAVGPWSELPDWELTGARSRSFTWRCLPGSTHEADFEVDARHRDCARIHEYVTDLWLFWDGAPIYRGRVGADSRSWGTRQTRKVSTADYRAVLARRMLYPLNTRSWSGLDQAAIAWAMVQQTQGNDGGQLGIVRGVGTSTGVTRSYDAEAGSWVAENVDKLAQMSGGFEWDVSPVSGSTALHLDIFHPTRGTDRGLVLEHGSSAIATGRNTDPRDYANAGLWTGGTPEGGGAEPTGALRQASDITTRPEGRWDTQEGNGDLTTQAALDAYADGRIAAVQVVQPSWTFKLARHNGVELVTSNVWEGPEQLWVGDPVLWVCRDGDLDVVETLRVVELTATLSDSGTVELTGALGALPPQSRNRARRVDQRLTALERR